jgi:hypothetical protein
MNEQEPIEQVAYAEAMRYMKANAQETLQKVHKEDHRYTDPEHVRTACGTAYNGVPMTFDMWLALNGTQCSKKIERASIDFYKSSLEKFDGIQQGFDVAYKIIANIKPEHELPSEAFKNSLRGGVENWLSYSQK